MIMALILILVKGERFMRWGIGISYFERGWRIEACSCSIKGSYQLNVWYEGRVPSTILDLFLKGDGE